MSAALRLAVTARRTNTARMRYGAIWGLALATTAMMACSSSTQAPVAQPAPVAEVQPVTQAPEPVVAETTAPEPAPAEAKPIAPTEGDAPLADQRPLVVALGSFSGPSAPTLRLKVTSAHGGLDAKATQRIMNMAQASFESCANSQKDSSPPELKLRFRISAKGNTFAVSAKSPIKTVADCVAKTVRKLQFEPSNKPTIVAATISFQQFASAGIGAGVAGGIIGGMGTVGYGFGRTQVQIGNATAKGNLDKNIIRRYIQRKLSWVRYCYEKELVAKPKLSGTVVVNFEIAASGNVRKADAKGINLNVSGCVEKAIRSIQFPKPRGGGPVTVRYPFTFRPASKQAGSAGTGRGGGGTGYGTIGIGSFGSIGRGSGAVSGYGTGGSSAPPSQVRVGNAITNGGLEKNIIRRFIRRKLPSVRHCYEKVLLRNPGLSGTVVVKFEIGADGSVSKATSKGMDASVADCVSKTLGTMQFPKPNGGGVVTVRYPFTFQPPSK